MANKLVHDKDGRDENGKEVISNDLSWGYQPMFADGTDVVVVIGLGRKSKVNPMIAPGTIVQKSGKLWEVLIKPEFRKGDATVQVVAGQLYSIPDFMKFKSSVLTMLNKVKV